MGSATRLLSVEIFVGRSKSRGLQLGRLGRLLATLALLGGATLLGLASPAAAVVVDEEIAIELAGEGSYLDFEPEAGLVSAIGRANAEGVAFVWLDFPGDDNDALDLADEYIEELNRLGSRYTTVLVLVDNGYAASSLSRDQGELTVGLDAALDGFQEGAIGRGVDAFVDNLTADDSSQSSDTPAPGGADGGSSSSNEDGGGIGIGTILLIVAVGGGGFFAVRSFLGRRRAARQAEVDLAEDRAEIEEQLKANADRMILLGDRVIASGNDELIALYEQASVAYQAVSHEIDQVETAVEVDELDDRIDHAEWQFAVIEAELDGRPRPAPPAPDPVEAADDPRPTERRSNDGRPQPPVATSPRTGRSYPRNRPRGRSGGLGGGLGSILAQIVLGGGLGGLGSSRRTQRRTGGGGIPGFPGGSGRRTTSPPRGGGGLGGGVLRRGGNRRPRNSGGRSLNRPRSRGGRRL